jgi:hypothetical protein
VKGIFKYLIGLAFWLVVYLIIRNTQSVFIPDLFHLSNFNQETTHEYFKLIAEITASIFAILMAVISLGYELLGKTARRRKRFSVLNKSLVAAYTSMAVTIILVSFYSSLSIENLKLTNDLTTAYFTGILFSLFVIVLFLFTIWLLSLSDTLKVIKTMILETSKEKNYSEDILDELIYYIQEHDRVAYRKNILPALTENTLGFIGDAGDRQQTNILLSKLTKVWMSCNEEASNQSEGQYFLSVWQNIQFIYEHAAKNKSFLLHFQELEDFIRVEIEFLAIKNNYEGLANAAKILSEIYLHQLKYNCPKQETISDLYWANEDKDAPNPHPDADLHWDHINDILWELHQIQKVAIELKSKYLYEAVKGELGSILFNLRYNHDLQLGNYQERFIVYQIFSFQIYYAQLALESRIYKHSVDAFHYSTFEIADYIKQQKIFASDLVKQIEDYLLYCQKNNFLDDFMSVRDLGGLARVISMEYANNTTVQNEFLFIVEIFNKLKNEIEKQNNFSENKNHSEIKKELQSLKDRLDKVEASPKSKDTINRIDAILNTY